MFIYYRYLDKFHVVPTSWLDLFEFLEYNKTDNEINKVLQAELHKDK